MERTGFTDSGDDDARASEVAADPSTVEVKPNNAAPTDAGFTGASDRTQAESHRAFLDARSAARLPLPVVLSADEWERLIGVAVERIDKRVVSRERFWRTLTAVVVVAFTALGISQLNVIEGRLKETGEAAASQAIAEVRSDLEDSIRATVGEQLSGAQTAIAEKIYLPDSPVMRALDEMATYTTFTTTAALLRERDSFTNEERDAFIAQLRVIAEKPELSSRADFPATLESVIDSFAQAGLGGFLEEIDDILGNVAVESQGITLTMLQHYGRTVIGNARPLIEIPEIVDRLERYIAAAHKHRLDGTSLPFELLVEYRRDKSQGGENSAGQLGERIARRTIQNLFQDVEALEIRDQRMFVITLEVISEPRAMSSQPSGTDIRVAELARSFFTEYEDELDAIRMNAGLPGSMGSGVLDLKDPEVMRQLLQQRTLEEN